ncbi:MAG: PP0621 family protein [Rhodoferax sp.]
MKYLLVFGIIFLVAWRWRSSRLQDKREVLTKKQAAATPLDIIACAECGVHVPMGESTQGKKGHYCSKAHLLRAEQ